MSEAYRRAGLTNEIYDRLLADKAMDFVYSKAEVTEIDAPAADTVAAEETENK